MQRQKIQTSVKAVMVPSQMKYRKFYYIKDASVLFVVYCQRDLLLFISTRYQILISSYR